MMQIKELECLDDFCGCYKGTPGYNVYISLVEFGPNDKGIVLAWDAGHPKTGNPVLITGKIKPIIQKISDGIWQFELGNYSPKDFPNCQLRQLIPLKTCGHGFVTDFLKWEYELGDF